MLIVVYICKEFTFTLRINELKKLDFSEEWTEIKNVGGMYTQLICSLTGFLKTGFFKCLNFHNFCRIFIYKNEELIEQ